MSEKKENLSKLIDFVSELANDTENGWFKVDLINRINHANNHSQPNTNLLDIKKDTSKIVEFLELNPSCSIDYSFIEHKLLRTRLELDNLRMENVRYNLKEKDEMKRLYDFCINAFYQIENLINYYYFEKFPNISDLLTHLESIDNTKFKRQQEKNVGDITISTKIYSFAKTHYNVDQKDFTGMNIDSLRLIRNEGLHRCTRIKNIENENPHLHRFIKYATFDSVHSIVNALTEKIKDLLKK